MPACNAVPPPGSLPLTFLVNGIEPPDVADAPPWDMKQAGIPETNYISKPKPTKDYRKNPLTRLKAAVKAAK